MNVAYLQCDMRYNEWLLEEVEGMLVIEHTISRIKKMGCKRILAGIYSCIENKKLISVLEKQGVEVLSNQEENVNIRFLNIVTSVDAEYVIRIGGDQLLVDTDRVIEIMDKMADLKKEWFYDEFLNCILPDIVSIKCLKKNKQKLLSESRYFEGLVKQNEENRYQLPYPLMIAFDFRVNSNEGFRICRNVIKNNLDIYEISREMIKKLYKNNYLVQTGIWGSWLLNNKSTDFFYDENKEINPWWGRTIIDFLKARLNKQFSVFEWGAGNSTFFWAQNVKEVISIEHSREWYEKMIHMIPANVKLKFCELEYGGEYCRAILKENRKFDIILIDGRDRVRCVSYAIERLKEDGIIIWDDTQRDYYEQGFQLLKEKGFKRIEFKSVAYKVAGYGHPTSIFYRNNNILNL